MGDGHRFNIVGSDKGERDGRAIVALHAVIGSGFAGGILNGQRELASSVVESSTRELGQRNSHVVDVTSNCDLANGVVNASADVAVGNRSQTVDDLLNLDVSE